MKKVNLSFLVVELLVLLACAVHIGIAYYNIAHDLSTSAPASVAFFLLIPYAIAAVVVGIVWLVVFLAIRRRSNA